MSKNKRDLKKDPKVDLAKKKEQAEEVPAAISRGLRLTVEIIGLVVVLGLWALIWDGTIPLTSELRAGLWGFVIATVLAIGLAFGWRSLHRRVVIGRYSVEGLLTQIQQTARSHERELRDARDTARSEGEQAAERRLGGDVRQATERAKSLQRQLGNANADAENWRQGSAELERARSEVQQANAEAQQNRQQAEAAKREAQELLATAEQVAARIRTLRRRRVERELRRRARLRAAQLQLTGVTEELRTVRDLAAAAAAVRSGAEQTVRDELATLRGTLEQVRGELVEASNQAAEAWNQIAERDAAVAAAQALVVRAIQAIEPVVRVKRGERFNPTGKSPTEIGARLEQLTLNLALRVDEMLKHQRDELSATAAEARARLQALLNEAENGTRELRQRFGALERELRAIVAERDAAQSASERGALERETLNTQLQELEQRLARALADLEALNATHAAALIALTEKEALVEQLRRELETLTEQAAELSVARTSLGEQIDQLAATNEGLSDRLRSAEALAAETAAQARLAQDEAAALREATPATVSAMMALRRSLATGDPESLWATLSALGLAYDVNEASWGGDRLADTCQALVLLGADSAHHVARILAVCEDAAAAVDPDEATDVELASAERASMLAGAFRELAGSAISRCQAIDWLLMLPPKERIAVVNATSTSDAFVMSVIAAYCAGRRKCRFVISTDAFFNVRDKLSPFMVACISSTLGAERQRTPVAADRIAAMRIKVMFYSPAVLGSIKRAGTIVKDIKGESAVANDPHSWSLWVAATSSPPDAESKELFAQARASLMALWCLSPAELRELMTTAIGDGAHDALRARGVGGGRSRASAAAAEMGFDPTFALLFLPTSKSEWAMVGNRATVYSLMELVSLSHPSRGPSGTSGKSKVSRAFDPYQAVVLAWIDAHNGGGERLADHMRTATLRAPEVHAKRFGDLGAQFFPVFAAALRAQERRIKHAS